MAGEAPATPRRRPTRPSSRLIAGGLLLILAILTVNVLLHGPLTGLDERIRGGRAGPGGFARVALARATARTALAPAAHRSGHAPVAVPVLAAVALALAIRRHTIRPLLVALTGVVLLTGTVIPAKIIIGRPGPACPRSSPASSASSHPGHTSTACICFSLAVLMLVAGQPARVRYLAAGRPGRALAGASGPRSSGVTTTGSRTWSRAGPCPGCSSSSPSGSTGRAAPRRPLTAQYGRRAARRRGSRAGTGSASPWPGASSAWAAAWPRTRGRARPSPLRPQGSSRHARGRLR